MWNIDNKKIQAFAAMFKQQQKKIVGEEISKERQVAGKLFKAVKDEYDKKNPLNKVVTKEHLDLVLHLIIEIYIVLHIHLKMMKNCSWDTIRNLENSLRKNIKKVS